METLFNEDSKLEEVIQYLYTKKGISNERIDEAKKILKENFLFTIKEWKKLNEKDKKDLKNWQLTKVPLPITLVNLLDNLDENLLSFEFWKDIESKYQIEIKKFIDENSMEENNYFRFKSKEEIEKFQKDKIGFCFPFQTTNVLKIDMLYGKRFNASTQEKEMILSRIEAKSSLVNCNILNLDLTTLEGKPEQNDPILIQIQSRGVGKTKSIYDLAMKKDVIYFDFSISNQGVAKSHFYFLLYNMIEKMKKGNTLEEKISYKKEVYELLQKFIISSLIHHGIFRKIYKEESSEFFFRYFLKSSDISSDLFMKLCDYDLSSLIKICREYKEYKIIAYDQVGCLVDLFQGSFLQRNIKPDQTITKNDFRGLFNVFSDAILNLRLLNYHQGKMISFIVVLSGTTLSITNVLTSSISAFKKEEIAVLKPITPFTEDDIKEILNFYFPFLNFQSKIYQQWSGRGKFIMQYFIKNLFQTAIDSKLKENDFQNICDSFNEKWMESAISEAQNYLEGYLGKETPSDKYQPEKKVKEILEYIYFDCVMRRKGRMYTLPYEDAVNLIQNGIMFLPSTFKENDFEIKMFKEIISFKSLEKFFQKEREKANDILFDPIIRLCYTDLIQEPKGSGYIWEDCFARFLMLDLKQSSKRESIQESRLMKDFIQKDPTLKYYSCEALYIRDESTYGKDFTEYLRSDDPFTIFLPDNFAGPDSCFPLLKLDYQKCIEISGYIGIETYKNLPQIRYIVVQNKFLSSENPLNDVKDAIQTCNLYKSYTRENDEKIEKRVSYEKFIQKNRMKINSSLGIICISGKIPNNIKLDVTPFEQDFKHSYQVITPLSFDFTGDLQNLLIKLCKLSEKKLVINAKELYDQKKYNEIIEMDLLEMFSNYELKTIEKSLNGKATGKNRQDIIENIKGVKNPKRLKLEDSNEKL